MQVLSYDFMGDLTQVYAKFVIDFALQDELWYEAMLWRKNEEKEVRRRHKEKKNATKAGIEAVAT